MSTVRVQPKKDAAYVVGVDLGGTNVRAAVLGRGETTLGRAENPSDAKTGVARTVERIGEAVRNACANANIRLDQVGAVGIAVPGHIDVPGGIVRWAPNFGHFDDNGYVPYKQLPLREMVSKELNVAMVMDNDANVAALGEFSFGAGRGTKHLVMFTL